MQRLILVRHAHRDTDQRELDNGISSKGKKQVNDLISIYQARARHDEDHFRPARFISSPKLRCVETLEPWADAWGEGVERDHRLLELQPSEGLSDLVARVENFTHWWVRRKPFGTTVLCSHGDWLPECLFHLVGHRIDLKKGGFAEVECSGGSAHLRWLVQGCKFFRDLS